MKANNSILLPPATSFKRNLLTLLIISSVAF